MPDNEILDICADNDDIEDEATNNEIEEAGCSRAEIQTAIMTLEERIKQQPPAQQKEGEKTATAPESEANEHVSSSANATTTIHQREIREESRRIIRAKLPKLETEHFNGREEEWQEFRDCFKGSIHSNPTLADVDKFSYLRASLHGQTHAAIAGFALTSANYENAIGLRKQRFGKRPQYSDSTSTRC